MEHADGVEDRLDDAELVSQARAGDLESYAQLVARFTPLAHRTAVFLGAGEQADDVVQEAFVKAYRALGRFRPDAPFRPWLLRIVAHETSNVRRAAGRRAGLALRAADASAARSAPSAEDALLAQERRTALLAAVEALPERMRDVVTCRYLLELSEAETAEVLGCPRGSVKSRLSRALGRLREALEEKQTGEVLHG